MQNDPHNYTGSRFYGRRKGKKLRDARQDAYDSLLPQLKLALPPAPVAAQAFFDAPFRDVWLEIGFGTGEHLLHQAQQNPDVGMLGCEPFVNGVASLCLGVRTQGLENIRVWPEDARMLLAKLEPQSVGRCFLLNADPWPKKRHAKRRFVQTEMLDEFYRILKPGAELRMSTDDPGLAAWELEKTYFHPGFEWLATCADDWRTRPADMVETRYQKKGAGESRPTVFLNFRRI